MITSTSIVENLLNQLSSAALNLGGRIVAALLILFIGSKLTKFALKLFTKTMEKTKADTSVAQFLHSLVKAALYVVLAFLVASYCGVEAASIVALLGSAGVAVGLALQGSLSNLAGGVLILVLRPFNVGDYIVDAAGNEGVVDEIQIFYTKLRTGDNKVIILPNGTLANNSITNVTTSNIRRCDITVGISYDADIRQAKDVLQQLINNDPKTLKDKDLVVYVAELADSSVNIGVRCWFDNSEYWNGLWRLNENIKYALDEANISIPYPQMDVHVKNQ
ncbi:MAG: mechanosensitive ion channel [Clostridia bacterium]|nr:mechanosensitive ion channel [Clostridia bacterium]